MRPPCPFRPGGRSRHVAVSLVAPSRLPEHPVRFNRKLKTPADCRCVPLRVLVVLRSVPAHGARRRFLVGRGTVRGRPTKKKPRSRFRGPPLHHLETRHAIRRSDHATMNKVICIDGPAGSGFSPPAVRSARVSIPSSTGTPWTGRESRSGRRPRGRSPPRRCPRGPVASFPLHEP